MQPSPGDKTRTVQNPITTVATIEDIAARSAPPPDKRTSGRPPKRHDQRRHILRASAKLIATIGYEECTLNRIANELDLTPPAIYHYFPTKQSIFTEVAITAMRGTYEAVKHAVNAAIDEGKNHTEQLHALMLAHADYFEQNYWLVNATIFGYAGTSRRDIERLEELESYRNSNTELLINILAGGVSAGEFRDIDPRSTARSIYQLLNITRWYRPGGKKTAADFAEANYQILMRGLGAAI